MIVPARISLAAGAVPRADQGSRVAAVQDAATRFNRFLDTTLQRDGWRADGRPLDVVLGDSRPSWRGNGQFVNGSVVIGDPADDGTDIARMPVVLMHEFAHGITRAELPQLGRGTERSAISEAFSDVLAAAASGGITEIGPFRDISKPKYATVADWSAASRARPRGTPISYHDLGSTLAHAGFLAASKTGWDAISQAWYGAVKSTFAPRLERWERMPVPDRVGPDGGPKYRADRDTRVLLQSFARSTIQAAGQLNGPPDRAQATAQALSESWKAIGIDIRARSR